MIPVACAPTRVEVYRAMPRMGFMRFGVARAVGSGRYSCIRGAVPTAINTFRIDIMSALNYRAALIPGSRFEACRMAETGFHASNLAASTFTSVNLSDAVFTDVNLGAAAFDDVNLGMSTLNNVNLGGIRVRGVNLSDASFTAANLDGALFADIGPRTGAGERVRNRSGVRFEDAMLNDSLFERCDMANIRLVDCDTEGMTIDGIPLADMLAAYRREQAADTGSGV